MLVHVRRLTHIAQNEGDVYEKDHTQSFWGSNYQRLLSIKNKYDPLRLMDCWQCGAYPVQIRYVFRNRGS
jgi:hypothetical protein